VWQRIQTIYLLLATIGVFGMFFFPFGIVLSNGQIYMLGVMGLKEAFGERTLVCPVWGFTILLILIMSLSIVTIFSFKLRIRQIRLCVFNICLLVGFYIFFLFFFLVVVREQYFEPVLNAKFTLSLPFVSIILHCLAIRSIGADEALIRSLNRLR
jgi:hypothetical protein